MDSKLTRDDRSGALISTDNNTLVAYKAARDKAIKVNSLHQEVQDLRNDITLIKELLIKLTNGK